MTNLHKALQTFWGGFSYGGVAIPAYERGSVPDSATLPYITYEVASGAYFGTRLATAYIWVPKTGDWVAKRAAILDDIEQAIPETGVAISFIGGNVMLRRNDANFISHYDPSEFSSAQADSTPVAGGRISYEITYYIP